MFLLQSIFRLLPPLLAGCKMPVSKGGGWRLIRGLAILWLSALSPVWAVEQVRLVTKHWPGYTNTDLSGGYFELIRLVLPPAQYQIKTEFSNFNRAVIRVQKEQAELVLAVTRVDGKQLLLSEFPIDADTIVAVYREQWLPKNSTLTVPQLAKHRLAWDLAYNYGQALGLDTTGFEVSEVSQGLELVSKGRVDVYLAEQADLDVLEARVLLRQQHLQQSELRQLPVYVGFSRSAKGLQLKREWDQQFRLLLQQGVLQQFYQQYPGMVLVTEVPDCAVAVC